jgi:IstB-like ATP binding protein
MCRALRSAARHDLLEILEERYGRRSTIITSQIPVDKWHEGFVGIRRLFRLPGGFLIAAIASIAICVTRSLLALDGSITLDQRRGTRAVCTTTRERTQTSESQQQGCR